LRLDIGGPPHCNPDGERIDCPHLHRFREGHGDRWAEPMPPVIGDPDDLLACLTGFLQYCNVVHIPSIRRQPRGLF
jgi:hypothetical protein